MVLAACAPRAVAEEPRATNTDCGVYALFVLFQLQVRPISLDQLDRALPPRHPEGYSMSELSRAAASLGLPLTGVRFDRGDTPLDGPVIAFFKDGHSGHFAVLRPIGTTGTMAQVIDPPHAPQVVDYEGLFRGKIWTGRILAVNQPRASNGAIYALPVATGLILLAIAARRRIRWIHKAQTPQAPTSYSIGVRPQSHRP